MRYLVTATSNADGSRTTVPYECSGLYAHSSHLVEIMRYLDEQYLNLESVAVEVYDTHITALHMERVYSSIAQESV